MISKFVDKMGWKSLVFTVALLVLVAFGVVDISGEMLSAPNTALNVFGYILLIVSGLGVGHTLGRLEPAFKRVLGMTALLMFVAMSNQACSRIEPGYVGIKVNLSGDNKGVQDTPVVTGWVFYNPALSSVYEYPTFVQTASWTKDVNEGSLTNEEISFNSKENLTIFADISLSYSLLPDHAPHFYVKYRSDNLERFTHGYMRNVARDAFNEVGGRFSVEDLLGPQKEKFLTEVKEKVNTHMKETGIVIDQFGFIGAPRPPESVIAAINAKITATQTAMKAENELRTAEAEAKKAVAKAEGDARSQLARAEGSAKSKIALAEGEAKANQVLVQSITPTLLEWRRLAIQESAVNKWDGKRPTVEGNSSGMLLQIDTK